MYLIKQMSVFSGSTQPMPGFLLAGHTSPVEPGFLPGMDKCKQTRKNGRPCTANSFRMMETVDICQSELHHFCVQAD